MKKASDKLKKGMSKMSMKAISKILSVSKEDPKRIDSEKVCRLHEGGWLVDVLLEEEGCECKFMKCQHEFNK